MDWLAGEPGDHSVGARFCSTSHLCDLAPGSEVVEG
jgi:hypothetical protein